MNSSRLLAALPFVGIVAACGAATGIDDYYSGPGNSSSGSSERGGGSSSGSSGGDGPDASTSGSSSGSSGVAAPTRVPAGPAAEAAVPAPAPLEAVADAPVAVWVARRRVRLASAAGPAVLPTPSTQRAVVSSAARRLWFVMPRFPRAVRSDPTSPSTAEDGQPED